MGVSAWFSRWLWVRAIFPVRKLSLRQAREGLLIPPPSPTPLESLPLSAIQPAVPATTSPCPLISTPASSLAQSTRSLTPSLSVVCRTAAATWNSPRAPPFQTKILSSKSSKPKAHNHRQLFSFLLIPPQAKPLAFSLLFLPPCNPSSASPCRCSI